MAVSLRSRGGNQGSAGTTLTHPAHAAGDRIVTVVAGKNYDTVPPTLSNGMVQVGSGTSGSTAMGLDTGSMFWAMYAKDATSAAEAAPVLSWPSTAANTWTWVTQVLNPGGGTWQDTIAASAPWVMALADTNNASPLGGTFGAAFPGAPVDGDAIAAWACFPTDSIGLDGSGTKVATCPGLTGGTTSNDTRTLTADGNDSGQFTFVWTGFSGVASGAPTVAYTGSFGTNHSGSMVIAALRLVPPPSTAAARTSALAAQVPMVVDPATVAARDSALSAQVPMTIDPDTVSARLSATIIQVVLVPNYNVRLLATGGELIVWDGATPRIVKALH